MALTTVQFLKVGFRRRLFSQYTQGSVASFATQFLLDWGSFLSGGTGLTIAAKTGAATVAEIAISANQVLEVNPTDYVGFDAQDGWMVIPASKMGRTVADGAINSNTNLTSATAAFVAGDQGANIAGVGIPSGTTILTVTNGTTVVLSAAATATATSVALTITPVTALFTPDIV